MKLIRLELTNFRQHLAAAIDFADGVTGVIGPNGAGKSTVLEGVAWALYGSPALRGNNDSVRSKAAPGGAKASVSLSFELTGSIYKAYRTLDASKTGTAVLEADGRALRSGTKEVNAAIAELLGMDYHAFFTSFFTGQKQLQFMANLEGRDRATAISRMLGYDRLSKAREKANADRLGLDREIEGLTQGLANPEELKERKKEAQAALGASKKLLEEAETVSKARHDAMDKLKPLKEASDQKAKRHEELTRRLEFDRADIARSEARLKDMGAEIADLKTKRVEFDALRAKAISALAEAGFTSLKVLGEEIGRLAELSGFEGERQRIGGQISALDADIKVLQTRDKGLSDATGAQTRAQAALETAEALLEETDKKIQACRESRVAALHSLEARIGQFEAQATQVGAKRAQIEEAGAEGKCPTCERPLAEELPTVLGNFDSQSKEILGHIESLKAEKSKLEQDDAELAGLARSRESVAGQIEALRKEKSGADAKVAELGNARKELDVKSGQLTALQADLSKLPGGFDEKRLRELERLKESLQPDRERAMKLNGELERQPRVEAEAQDLEAHLQARLQQVGASEKSLAEIAFSQDDHGKLTQDYETVSTELTSALLAVEKQRGDFNTATAILGQVEREEESYKTRTKALEDKRSLRLHLYEVAKALEQLRAELNNRIRPELESIASELLSEMTDGRYSTLRIDDSYKAVIVDDGEEKPVISGGEDDIVNLALRLAVSQMIADRAGQALSLLVLDEVFGSLDDVRRDNVVSLLQNLKNRFEQIILITHVESIHDAVDNCLWVSFDEKTKTSRLIDRSMANEPTPAGGLL